MTLLGKAAILSVAYWVCYLFGQLLLAVSYGQSPIGFVFLIIATLVFQIFPVVLPYLAGVESRAHAVRDVVWVSVPSLFMLLLRPFAEGIHESWAAPLNTVAPILFLAVFLWAIFKGTAVLVSKREEYFNRTAWAVLMLLWIVIFPIIVWRVRKLQTRAGEPIRGG